MLTSLLPGFRHLRTPFALGVLWAFQIWILVGEYVPGRSGANGFLERLYVLGEVTGRAGVTAAISFVLYMGGDIVRLTSTQMLNLMTRILRITNVFGNRFSSLSAQSRYELREYAEKAFALRENANDDDVNGLMQKMVMEFAEIRMHLIASHLDVYMEHDRYDSEADFRMNVGVYSVSLWGILAWQWTPWALIGILASIVLFDNGLKARRDANAILVQAVVSRIVESRFFKEEKERDHPANPSTASITYPNRR
ncbi:hypothetical protein ACFZA9_06390 [Streptomyces olivaceus]|uniref:hypothetical protein n=1 Tax=Streptomyces olivaceus TaxID=47716 RepID=UPI0036E94FC4